MLRVASSNAMSLAKLRQLVGMGDHETFNAHHETAFLGLVGLASGSSVNLFPNGARHGAGHVSCYGHDFRVRSMLRCRRPQICVACVRDGAFCDARWDLSLSVLCLRHRCLLQDRCPSCGALLRWDRPSVEWSHCKHYLGREPTTQGMPEQLFLAQQITEELFHGSDPDFSPLGIRCPGISLDAWFSLLWALGVKEETLVPPRRGIFISTPSAVDVRGMALRAVTRLIRCKASDRGLASLAEEVAEAPLLGTILSPIGQNDRALALGWYGEIFGARELNALVRRHRSVAQMSLF